MSNPWMPLYIGDIKRKTDDLGPLQYGIYMRLIEWAWDHGGKIPLDVTQLANITRCERRLWWRYGAPIVQRFFDTVDASTATQKRVVTELHRSAEISNKRKAAALQMHSKRRANASILHNGLHTQSQSQSPSKEVTVTVIPSSQSTAPPARSGSNGPRAGNAAIGDRIGNWEWTGSAWMQRDPDERPFGVP